MIVTHFLTYNASWLCCTFDLTGVMHFLVIAAYVETPDVDNAASRGMKKASDIC